MNELMSGIMNSHAVSFLYSNLTVSSLLIFVCYAIVLGLEKMLEKNLSIVPLDGPTYFTVGNSE
jgi:hypothetical protein